MNYLLCSLICSKWIMKLLFKLTQQQTLSRYTPFFICGKKPISVKLEKLGTLLLTASSLWSPQIKRIDLCLPLMPDCEFFESSAFIGDRDSPSTDCFGSRRTNSRRKQDGVTLVYCHLASTH